VRERELLSVGAKESTRESARASLPGARHQNVLLVTPPPPPANPHFLLKNRTCKADDDKTKGSHARAKALVRVCVCVFVYVGMYVHKERERERKRGSHA